MKCDSRTLTAYALGVADEAQTQAIQTHLASCPACAQRLAELRRTAALLDEVPEVENEPVDMAQLQAAIETRKRAVGRLARIWERVLPKWRWAAALAATACLIALCFRYGAAVRVGRFEIAVGGPKFTAEERIRQIARHEIATRVAPGMQELAQYVSDLEVRRQQDLIALRSDFVRWRAVDEHEVRRTFAAITSGVNELLAGQP